MNKPSPTTEALVARLRRTFPLDSGYAAQACAAADVIERLSRELAELRAQQPPREPTTEMMLAGMEVQDREDGQDTEGVWKAMYDAGCPPRSAEG